MPESEIEVSLLTSAATLRSGHIGRMSPTSYFGWLVESTSAGEAARQTRNWSLLEETR